MKTRILTKREAEIVALVAKGKTNIEIANDLKIKSTTVKGYLHRIFIKANVESREQLILWAVK